MERVLFVLAHADDLVAVTGTAATVQARGGHAAVLVAVRGRDTELLEAAHRLGIEDVRFLGQEGARWPGRAPRRYLPAEPDGSSSWLESLEAADAGEVAADVASVVDAVKPDAIVALGDTDGGPDRTRIQRATALAAEVMDVPWFTAEPMDARGGMRVDVAAAGPARAAAAEALGLPVPESTVERFRRQRSGPPRFQDYGIVSRIVSCVVAAVLGAAAGVLLTAVHQATAQIGEMQVPWGVVVAIAVAIGLFAGLRIVFGSRLVVACAAAAFVAAGAVLAIRSEGGSLLVLGNPLGYLWTFAPLVIGGLAVAWPGRRPSAAK